MPNEFARKLGRKTINLPNGRSVDIPVITEISFLDPIERAQEMIFTIDDTPNADRNVHIDSVQSSTGSGSISVERIDQWKVMDPVNHAQETYFAPNNINVGGGGIPHFPHFKTHIETFTNSNGDYVKSEFIDETRYLDPVDRAQETYWSLDNTGNNVRLDGSEPTISGGSPYRTDPFQNIVDFSGASGTGGSAIGIWSAGTSFAEGSFVDPPAGQELQHGSGADYPTPPWVGSFVRSVGASAQVQTPDPGGVHIIDSPFQEFSPGTVISLGEDQVIVNTSGVTVNFIAKVIDLSEWLYIEFDEVLLTFVIADASGGSVLMSAHVDFPQTGPFGLPLTGFTVDAGGHSGTIIYGTP